MQRIERRTYWIILAAFTPLVLAVWMFLGGAPGITLVAVFAAIPRLHDLGRTGTWTVALLVPGTFAESLIVNGRAELFIGQSILEVLAAIFSIGFIVLLGVLPGKPGDNAYGPPTRRAVRRATIV